MSDTGQVPGEGLPENAGTVEQPGVAAPDAYTGLAPSEYVPEDDDLLLMPSPQGAWSDPQPVPSPAPYADGAAGYAPVPAQGGHPAGPAPRAAGDAAAHPQGPAPVQEHVPAQQPVPGAAQDAYAADAHATGSADLQGVRIPAPVPAPHAAQPQAQVPAPARRPLRRGPAAVDAPSYSPTPTGGVVRSLADRGPAEVPQPQARTAQPQAQTAAVPQPQAPAPQAGAPLAGPDYFGDASALPGPQLGQILPQGGTPWSAPAPQPVVAPATGAAAAPDSTAPESTAPEPVAPESAVVEAVVAEAVAPESAVQEAVQEEAVAPVAAAPEATAPEAAVPEASAGEAVAPGTAAQDATAAPEPAAGPVDGPAPAAQPAPEPSAAPETVDAAAPADAPAEPVEVPAQEAGAPAQGPEDAAAPEAEAAPGTVPGPAAVAQAEAATTAEAAETEAAATPEAVATDAGAEPVEATAPTTAAPGAAEAVPVEPVTVDTVPAPVEAVAPEAGAETEAAEAAVPAEPVAPVEPVVPADDAAPAPVPAPVEGAVPAAPQTEAAPAPVAAETAAAETGAMTAAAEPAPAETAEQVPAETAEPAPVETAEPVAAEDGTPVQPADLARAVDADEPAEAPQSALAGEPVGALSAEPARPAPAAEPAGAAPDPAPAPARTPAPAPVRSAAPAQDAAPEGPSAAEPEPEAAPAAAAAPEAAPAARPAPAEAPQDGPRPEPAAATAPEDGAPHPAAQPEAAETPGPDATPAPTPAGPPAPGYDDAEREAVLRVMRDRRDIRNGFRSDPIPHEVLLRVLEAAHTAPSVGHSQPWDFVVIRSAETRRSMHELAQRQRDAYAKSLPKGRAKHFKELKIEAILDTPVNIVVTADPTRGGRHTLGRHTQPQMAPYSSALAVENLWLAARAEGLGVGWVSFFDEREMVRALGLPEHLEVVAYLCVGYVDEFPEEPELVQAGWSRRRPLSWVVHEETYGRRALPGEEPHDLLQETIANIRPLDAKALGEAWERQKRMTKPAGALGMLEIISAQLSGLSRVCPPPVPEPAAVAIFAGDHGVHAQGVTAWPQEVTGQMVANFLGGGAVCNAFAAQVGAEVCVVDVGVAMELPATPGLLPRKVRAGTADFTTGPALTREEVLAAVEVGIETARDLVAAGNKGLLIGEMGIANTTASAALVSVYTGLDPAEVTGRGTGINDEMHARKVDVVRRALELHQPDPADPIGVLAAVGGLEHAAMAGFLLGGASLRTPVILDGVSAGAAALVARAIAPEALAACIAGHRSAEPGHVAALNKLGLRPLVDLDLRLGEGTGALLALPIVQSAARAMHEVATFDTAGVTEK
ncbi:nicotinate-nucleotide--dimethylbenzimidazole phosphoribosyltransferase [Streptomyces sp. PTD5-9]|uniref:nicotinate-nucleotide--dimethylbenzimidazole phosphoribosyltransferase n=1 Tax=Streptomyces sp. PTD5-9 TaxID=3120150 RepID=UPI0030091E5C